jgi:hypothetical protein
MAELNGVRETAVADLHDRPAPRAGNAGTMARQGVDGSSRQMAWATDLEMAIVAQRGFRA